MDYELGVIGGGAAAFAAAIKADELGAKAVMINGGTIGGTCVNVGCVPSKRMLTLGDHYFYALQNGFPGINYGEMGLEYSRVVDAKNALIRGLRRKKYSDVVRNLEHVGYVEGKAKFESKHRLSVNGKSITARKFVIATGSSPKAVPVPGVGEIDYLTNVEALDTKEVPDSIVIIGGRALGLEFSQIFAHFGAKVTVLQRSNRIIPEEEPEISKALRKYLEEEGITIHTGVSLLAFKRKNKAKEVHARIGKSSRIFKADEILMAAGRKPNTDDLNLDAVGVRTRDDGAIMVDREMRTSASHIWAGGDVKGEPMLETIAAREGSIAAENALTNAGRKIDYLAVPKAVFTSPQVATVGLTEKELLEKGFECNCRTLQMKNVPKALITGQTRGLVKIVIDNKTHRIFGVHILSDLAADMIHEGVLAVKNKLTIEDIIDTVHVFPTMSEALKLAAQSFTKDVTKLSCCVE